jgi:hypothetical protein
LTNLAACPCINPCLHGVPVGLMWVLLWLLVLRSCSGQVQRGRCVI